MRIIIFLTLLRMLSAVNYATCSTNYMNRPGANAQQKCLAKPGCCFGAENKNCFVCLNKCWAGLDDREGYTVGEKCEALPGCCYVRAIDGCKPCSGCIKVSGLVHQTSFNEQFFWNGMERVNGKPLFKSHSQKMIGLSGQSNRWYLDTDTHDMSNPECTCTDETNYVGNGGAACDSLDDDGRTWCYVQSDTCSDGKATEFLEGAEWSNIACETDATHGVLGFCDTSNILKCPTMREWDPIKSKFKVAEGFNIKACQKHGPGIPTSAPVPNLKRLERETVRMAEDEDEDLLFSGPEAPTLN